jgi:hypothetical protein
MIADGLNILLCVGAASAGWVALATLMSLYVMGPTLARYHEGDDLEEEELPASFLAGGAHIIPFPTHRLRRA